eukprot:11314857-Alexandrium_andersonii.AAC.1
MLEGEGERGQHFHEATAPVTDLYWSCAAGPPSGAGPLRLLRVRGRRPPATAAPLAGGPREQRLGGASHLLQHRVSCEGRRSGCGSGA